jgi:hypothetical protein
VARWSSAEPFWIAKNGIRMTGMPAFGSTHKDEEIWKVVAFVQRLPMVTEGATSRWNTREGLTRSSGAGRPAETTLLSWPPLSCSDWNLGAVDQPLPYLKRRTKPFCVLELIRPAGLFEIDQCRLRRRIVL